MTRDRTSEKLATLIVAFERLSAIDDPVLFPIELEEEQKKSGLRLGTFKAAFQAWKAQQDEQGEA